MRAIDRHAKTTQPETGLDALRQSLSAYKLELAKVIVGMQTGGDRKTRRDLTRRMDACKRRARALSRQVDEALTGLDADHEARPELETAAGVPEQGAGPRQRRVDREH